MTTRRSFLRTVGAAFCGAVLYTFPDFGLVSDEERIVPGSVLADGLRSAFDDAYKKQFDRMLKGNA